MTIAAVARRHKLGWHVVMALVRCWADLVAEHRRSRRCRVLLVDETSMRRRPGPPRDPLRRHPRLRSGWEALQQLHGLYTADDHHSALEALERFCDLHKTGELPEFHDIVDTIIAWSDEIFAWHHSGRASNGTIEGTNNLLHVLRRTAHGY